MRNFITIKNKNERKIFLNYCKKHNTKSSDGKRVTEYEKRIGKVGFQVFFGERFDRLSYALNTITYAQECGFYNEIKFNDFFKANNTLEIE